MAQFLIRDWNGKNDKCYDWKETFEIQLTFNRNFQIFCVNGKHTLNIVKRAVLSVRCSSNGSVLATAKKFECKHSNLFTVANLPLVINSFYELNQTFVFTPDPHRPSTVVSLGSVLTCVIKRIFGKCHLKSFPRKGIHTTELKQLRQASIWKYGI